MSSRIKLGNEWAQVTFKDIKNVHLSVHPPTGRVTISAPLRMELSKLRVFAISKLDWIRREQRKLREQDRETPREFLERESHYVWGKRYLLKLIEKDAPPSVRLMPRQMHLSVRPGTTIERRQALVDEWYRSELKREAQPLIQKWESVIGVNSERFFVQRMKTKWGSCTPATGSIRLNTELAKKPKACLEYIVVHELIHLLEPTHNQRFVSLMDKFMPHWQLHRKTLNELPIRHVSWNY